MSSNPVAPTVASGASPHEAVAALDGAFRQAWSGAEGTRIEEWYRVADRPVRVRVTGPDLRDQLLAALGHLRTVPGNGARADLTIDIWNCKTTGVPCPVPTLRDAVGRTWPYGRTVLGEEADGSIGGIQSHGLFLVFERSANRILGCVLDIDHLTPWDRSKPLFPLFLAWLSGTEFLPVHSAFVARGGNGVLLGGAGGSGKSTSAAACLAGGFDFLGDDFVWTRPATNGAWEGLSLYNSCCLDVNHSKQFRWYGESSPTLPPLPDHKSVALSGDRFPDRLPASAWIRAIALPRVCGGRDCRVRPAGKAEALLRLAPSSVIAMPFASGKRGVDRLTEIVSSTPAFWLDLGEDVASIPHAVDGILRLAEATG